MQITALNVAGIIFLVVSIMHLIRVIVKAKIIVNGRIVIPLWISIIASLVLLSLAVYMFIAARR